MSDASTPALGPLQISEIILHTAQFDAMKAWYQTLFGGLKPVVDIDSDRKLTYVPNVKRICFLRIHSRYPYTQVLGLFEIPELRTGAASGPGLDHMQFREANLESLFARYRVLKAAGLRPHSSYDHGPATSFYYADPDGNHVELSAVNFATEEAYLAFMRSEQYLRNVEGYPVDPDAHIAAHAAGGGG